MGYSLEHEYEIKLRIPADAIDRIGTLLAKLKRFAKAERVRLQSTYYDDQDFSLLHQGLCLRIVDNGTSMVQTLKDLYPKSGQCPLRQELNVQLSSNALDLNAIKEPLENYIKAPGLRKWQWTNEGIKVINGRNILLNATIDLSNTGIDASNPAPLLLFKLVLFALSNEVL